MKINTNYALRAFELRSFRAYFPILWMLHSDWLLQLENKINNKQIFLLNNITMLLTSYSEERTIIEDSY